MKFQDDISNMNTHTHTHTHGQAETNMSPTFSKLGHNKMLILVHRKMNVLYVWLVSSKYIYRLQS